MLAVLLTVLSVLKIIGIVLLCILAFVLFILILVLFVPVRYRLDALIPETDLDEEFDVEKTDVRAKFSWLLFVIRGGISFPKDKAFTLRVFGIKILPKKGKAEKDEKAGKADKAEKVEKADNAEKDEKEADGKEAGNSKDGDKKASLGDDAEKEPGGETSGDGDDAGSGEGAESESGRETTGDGDGAGSGEGAESKPGRETTGDGGEKDSHGEGAESESGGEASGDGDGAGGSADADLEEDEEDKSFLDVLWGIFDGIDNFLKTPLNVLEKIQYTISRVCDKIDVIKSTIENDIFKRAFELVKKKLIKIIRMILPDKCDIDVMFGSGDPATTAEIFAAYGALYPILFKKVSFRPDFERKAVHADVHIRGHITLFTIVWSAAVCYFNRDVKKTIRRFKKIMKS